MTRSIQRKKAVLLSLFVVILVHFIPISISGTSYWDVQTGFWWNSDPSGGDGYVQFSDSSSFEEQRWTLAAFSPTEVHNFTEFRQVQRGDAVWRETRIGFNMDPQANGTLTLLGDNELTIRIDRTGPAMATSYILAPGRPEVVSVTFSTFGGSWTWNTTSRILQVQTAHTSPVVVHVLWGPTSTQQIFATVFEGWDIASLLVLALATSTIIQVMTKRKLEPKNLAYMVAVVIILAVGLIMISRLYELLP